MIETTMFAERMEKPARTTKSKYAPYLTDFMNSDNKTLKFTCSNNSEAVNCYTCISKRIKSNGLNLVLWKRNNEVYVIKG